MNRDIHDAFRRKTSHPDLTYYYPKEFDGAKYEKIQLTLHETEEDLEGKKADAKDPNDIETKEVQKEQILFIKHAYEQESDADSFNQDFEIPKEIKKMEQELQITNAISIKKKKANKDKIEETSNSTSSMMKPKDLVKARREQMVKSSKFECFLSNLIIELMTALVKHFRESITEDQVQGLYQRTFAVRNYQRQHMVIKEEVIDREAQKNPLLSRTY